MKGTMRTLDTLLLSATLSLTAVCSFPLIVAADTLSQSSTTTQQTQTMPTGDTTIIQHVDSKMEPTVVQSRTATDPATGEKEKVVEPLIMERHDKVLDTTIIQPQVNETTTTTEKVLQQKQTHTVPAVPVARPPRHKAMVRPVHRHHVVAMRHTAPVKHVAEASNTEVMQTTEVTRQPVLKETFIKGSDPGPSPEPQVVQKTDAR